VIGYEETRKYVRKVFMNYLYYLNLYGEGWADSATVQ
jgi:soluble lytic murein transglycosylase-like protein